jgi:hypothetical protein
MLSIAMNIDAIANIVKCAIFKFQLFQNSVATPNIIFIPVKSENSHSIFEIAVFKGYITGSSVNIGSEIAIVNEDASG